MKNRVSINNVLALIIIITSLISVFSLFSQSIRLDEAQSIWTSTKTIPFLLKLTAQDVNLPLYGVILHFWLQIFGTNIAIARSLSLLFFIITLPVLFVFTKESSNIKQALLTTAIFALSPFIVWYTSEARTYTLFALMTTLSHLFFLRLIRSKLNNGKLGYFLSAVLGLYTHYFFIFILVTQGLFVLIRLIISKSKNHTTKFNQESFFTLGFFMLVFSAIFMFLPWLAYMIRLGGASNTQPLIPPPTSYNIIQAFVNFIFGFQPQVIQSLIVSLWPLSIVVLFFIFTQKKHRVIKNPEYFLLSVFVPTSLVFLGSFFKPIFLSRYLILVTPTLFFLTAWTLMSYSKKMSNLFITLFLIIVFGLLIFQNVSAATPVKEDYSDVVGFIDNSVTPNDIVAASAPFTIYPIEYQYKGTAKLTTIPEWDRYVRGSIPVFNEQTFITQINDYKKIYNRIFLVLSYDQGYEKDIKNYMDTHYEMLANKQFSSTINLRVYKLRYN